MTSSPGLPLPLSQGSPTVAIWFIWKFYQCSPSPSSRIQTTWVMSMISHISNWFQLLPVDPAEHCQLLHRLPHHLPLRGGHLCSRLWDSVHQGGEDPGDLPSVIPIYLAFLPGRASSGVDYRLFHWEDGRRPETCSCGNWVKDAAERVWEWPDRQRRFQRRGNGEGWCWKPGGLRSRKRPVSKKFWVVLSKIHA